MPHRLLPAFQYLVLGVIDVVSIGFIAAAGMFDSTMMAITDTDWDRLIGPHGFTVGLILAVVALWATAMRRETCENKRRESEETAREKRHQDSIRMQRDNANDLKSITVESIKAQMLTASALSDLKEASEKTSISIDNLFVQLSTRPCQALTFKKPGTNQ